MGPKQAPKAAFRVPDSAITSQPSWPPPNCSMVAARTVTCMLCGPVHGAARRIRWLNVRRANNPRTTEHTPLIDAALEYFCHLPHRVATGTLRMAPACEGRHCRRGSRTRWHRQGTCIAQSHSYITPLHSTAMHTTDPPSQRTCAVHRAATPACSLDTPAHGETSRHPATTRCGPPPLGQPSVRG